MLPNSGLAPIDVVTQNKLPKAYSITLLCVGYHQLITIMFPVPYTWNLYNVMWLSYIYAHIMISIYTAILYPLYSTILCMGRYVLKAIV